jgi:hypothetical protein
VNSVNRYPVGVWTFSRADHDKLWSFSRVTWAASLMVTALSSVALAQIGTPPPFFCGRTYVLSAAVPDGNVAADQATTVRVYTLHFLNLIEFDNQCPDPPYSVSMSASLGCVPGPSSGPTAFGPFAHNEGFKVIPIDVPIPADAPRLCDLVITATVTFADGMQIAQTAEQKVSIVEPAPGDPLVPRITIQNVNNARARGVDPLGRGLLGAAPGDEAAWVYRITNNDPDQPFIGELKVDLRNVAGLPTVLAGTNDTGRGVFALADSGGGDNFPLAFGDAPLDDGCLTLPPTPHTTPVSVIEQTVEIGPGETRDIEVRSRSWPLSAEGAAGQSSVVLEGAFYDSLGRGYSGSWGAAGGVHTVFLDSLGDAYIDPQPPQFGCPNQNARATLGVDATDPNGPAAGLLCGTSDCPAWTVENQGWQVNFGLDLAGMQLLVNGSPISSGQNFSGITQVDGQHVRNVAEFSFIQPRAPPNAVITMVTPIDIKVTDVITSTNPMQVDALWLDGVSGAPNGFDDVFPAASGEVTLVDPDSGETAVVKFVQQFSAVGVEVVTFNSVPMTNISVDIDVQNPNRYVVTSTWTATNPGTRNMLGFDVMNDYRGVATRPTGACCPVFGDCQDGVERGYCEGFGGLYAGDGTLCVDTICPEQTGACCYRDGGCFAPVAQSDCVVGGNIWHHNQTCEEVTCSQTCTPGDLNGDDAVNGLDIQGFADCQAEFAAGCGCADMDSNDVLDENDASLFVEVLLGEPGTK